MYHNFVFLNKTGDSVTKWAFPHIPPFLLVPKNGKHPIRLTRPYRVFPEKREVRK